MWTENKKAVSEVYTILKQMSPESIAKIPSKMMEEIRENATENTDYIKPGISLDNIKLEKETKEILAVISYNYFCNEEEKKVWNKELEENEQKYQKELERKYNIDKLFDKSEKVLKTQEKFQNNIKEENHEQNSLVEYKESFLKKVLNKILKFFNK